MFIVFEGIDGSGKTTQAKALSAYLASKGIKCFLTKEPTNGPIGRFIRQNAAGIAGSFVKVNKSIANKEVDSMLINQFAMQALFVSDRLYHIEQFIKPKLKSGYTVISDRYILSTIAYGMAAGISKGWLVALNRGLIEPDVTLLLDISPAVALKRIGARGSKKELFEKELFLSKAQRAYLKLAKTTRGCIVIDAEESKDEVAQEIKAKIDDIV
ncbi:MAG: dTMP kinase [Candidatus Micrarchaeaceae archaeon]